MSLTNHSWGTQFSQNKCACYFYLHTTIGNMCEKYLHCSKIFHRGEHTSQVSVRNQGLRHSQLSAFHHCWEKNNTCAVSIRQINILQCNPKFQFENLHQWQGTHKENWTTRFKIALILIFLNCTINAWYLIFYRVLIISMLLYCTPVRIKWFVFEIQQ